jgi:ATP-dependent DNA helicase DinG
MPYVYWLIWDDKKTAFSFSRALIDVGTKLASDVYPLYQTSIFTSATLKAGNKTLSENIGFNSISGTIYNKDLISIKSPFDYEKNSVMCFLKDTQAPYNSSFVPNLSLFIGNISEILEGKTLVLFSSIKRMNECYKTLCDNLEHKGYKIFMQGMGGDVVEYFKSEDKSILLGSESFGEGLDIKGKQLSCVILERMPIVIKDSVYIAREELFKKRHNTSSFEDFELPQRLLKLRQWSGRLIRSNTDKGMVIIYDNWFSKQDNRIRKIVADSIHPMPVVLSSENDIKTWIKEKYEQWYTHD